MPPLTVFTHSIEHDNIVYSALAYKRAALLYRYDEYGEPIDPDYAPFDSIYPNGRKDIEAFHSGTMGNSRREDALVPVLKAFQKCIDEGSVGVRPLGPPMRVLSSQSEHILHAWCDACHGVGRSGERAAMADQVSPHVLLQSVVPIQLVR